MTRSIKYILLYPLYSGHSCSHHILHTIMIPLMPALIPASNVIHNKSGVMIPGNQHPPGEDTARHTGDKVLMSDKELHKALDDQIQLVKQIQTLLGTEQMKLEMMMQQFNKENMKRKEKMLAVMESVGPKRLRVCSPDYINRKKSVEMGVRKTVKNDRENMRDKDEGEYSADSLDKELQTFRNFWSPMEEVFNDKDIKEEPNRVDIKDLVMEELALEDKAS